MNNRNFTFAGAALLIAGLFVPIVSFPVLGTVNLFNNGSNHLAIALVVLAAIAAFLASKDRQAEVIWPAAATAGILLYAFARLQYAISQMRESLKTELADNPFAGLAQAAVGSIQLQWGWLLLALATGLLIYSAVKAEREEGARLLNLPADGLGKAVVAVSVLLVVATAGYDLLRRSSASVPSNAGAGAKAAAVSDDAPTTTAEGPSADEAAYIKNNLRLYDLEASYQNSLLDGRVPGVNFKLKNSGNRTLNKVSVRVVFYDAEGNAIAEEEYTPVVVSEYNIGDNNPLRPNYIYQNEPDKFWVAKKVPSEWQEGKATATITDIDFAPRG